jgi:hypothetical protein
MERSEAGERATEHSTVRREIVKQKPLLLVSEKGLKPG